MSRPEYLVLARVVRSRGVRGAVKVLALAEEWGGFRALARCWLGPAGGPFEPFELEAVEQQGRTVILNLAGVESPEAASRLVGYEVAIPRAEAPAPPEGSYYHYDILGLQVVDGGRALGSVCEILETAGHDVYVVRGPIGEWMLPATRVHIRRIDLAAGCIQIEPMEGLVSPPPNAEENAEAF